MNYEILLFALFVMMPPIMHFSEITYLNSLSLNKTGSYEYHLYDGYQENKFCLNNLLELNLVLFKNPTS